MKKIIQNTLILLMFVSIFSCGRQKNDLSNKGPKESNRELLSPNEKVDFDPYFIKKTDSISNSAPKNITRNLIQDRKGNYWLATWEGIVGYDGTSFTNFTIEENLRPFRAFAVLEDQLGNIWFGTIGAGIYLYDGKTFTNLTMNDGLVHNDIYCIYEDSKGDIWFGTKGGVSRYDGKIFSNYTTEDGLLDNDTNSIIEDEKGQFWFGARGEACMLNDKAFTKAQKPDSSAFINVRSIIEDSKGTIWLGGNDGLWKFEDGHYLNISTEFVGYIYEDSKGNIWTSSESPDNNRIWTLTKYSIDSFNVKVNPIFSDDNMFFGILEDTKGDIWFGSLNGVHRYNGTVLNNFKAVTD